MFKIRSIAATLCTLGTSVSSLKPTGAVTKQEGKQELHRVAESKRIANRSKK